MKVIFITHYPGVGGANLSMLYMVKNLKKMGVEPLVLLPSHGPIEDLLLHNGIPYKVFRFASLRTADRGRLRNAINLIIRLILNISLSIYLSFSLRGKVDIIHNNSSLVFLGWFLSKLMHKPLVWHVREFGKDDYNLIFLQGRKLAAKCYEDAEVVIAISKSIENFYRTQVCSKANIRLVYNGIEPTTYTRLTNDRDTTRICIVGGVSPQKNQVELIEAAKLLDPHLDFTIDVIGDGEPQYICYLKELVAKGSLSNRIRFLGERNDVPKLLQEYDIGVITSQNEAFGRVIIEYMFAKLAVVASNAGACTELIKSGVTGVLYELGSPQDLANKLNILICNHKRLWVLAISGYENSIKEFTASANASRILEIYREL